MSVTLDVSSSSRVGAPDRRPSSRDPESSRGLDSMESEIAQNLPMTTVAGRTKARGWAEEIVKRDEGRVGSKMLAYGELGRKIGRSDSWVRRLIGGEAVGLAHETFERMRLAYLRHCERIEAEAAAAARRAALLKAQNDDFEARLNRPATGGD